MQSLKADDPFGIRVGEPRIRIPFRGNQTVRSLPVSDLPQTFTYPRDKVSLLADFKKHENNRVPVYLINAGEKNYRMETVAMEIPIVLEAYLGNGHWERAESQNAYGFLSTRKEEFVSASTFRVKKARHWSEGEPATLRYALYQDGKAAIFTEAFQGKLPIGEIDKARHDLMTASLVPEPIRIRYFPGQTSLEEIEDEWYHKLTLLRSFGPCYVDLEEAQKWAAFVHENPVSSRQERDLAVRLQLEMLKKWPAKYDLSGLHKRCRAILKEGAPGTQALRPLCWRILRAESEENSELKDPALVKVAWETIQSESTLSELEAATDFLCVNHIASNFSPILEYKDHEKLLDHSNPYVRITAAHLLLSKKKNTALVLNHYLENEEKVGAYELVRILHFDRLYNPYEKPNWTLWERALEKDTEYTISQLSLLFESDNTPTKLRKFSQSSVLPASIRQRLVKYSEGAPNGPKKQAIQRLLDDVNTSQSRFFQRTFL
ncbi:MAG: hypothetical protein P1V20_06150 [Verrucomicrobiales bacterium]|nr:hypothetical protein [Verrucomicrobiales bacterium]